MINNSRPKNQWKYPILLKHEIRRITAEISRRLPVIPASITWIRLLGVPAILLVIYRTNNMKLLFWIILICSLSDYLDGWVARRLKQTTYPGKVMDFIADKLFLSVALFSLSISLGVIDTVSASILAGYHLLMLLALSVISWSILIPVVTITTGERLAVLFSYLLLIVASGKLAFPDKHLFISLQWPLTIIALLSALAGLLSYLRLLKRLLSRILE
ncbi:MAG: CDP-alcohol phosphatidyltransferase family protein [Candidatus Fermentibacteraceae bacterium]|nr:CDP-alcohol phosphatidyltransferase family protein [Candidatus Fermentibacteraceae bacterium]